MSWQIAIMLLLAATLVGGVVWYERSRPPSQVVALVAALAALAVAARLAFSPIPNVLPTTDLALLSGFALGPAPGFAVGALAGLISNFWLGQGPWTPWQMAGWGMTGLFGAALAAATGRRIGRIVLAAACGLAAFAYGALLDLSLMVTYGGEQSLDRFLAISARGLPFNVAHAVGNVAFALVAGPALVRMLGRYRRRFDFAWPGRGGPRSPAGGRAAGSAASVLVAVLLAGSLLGDGAPAEGAKPRAGGATAAASGAGAALAWLRAAQNADGGFAAERGGDSHPAMTGWAVLGMEAAGRNPLDVRRGRRNPIAYLRRTAGQIRTTGDTERTILALAGAGLNPRRFQGRDLVRRLLARRAGDGSWEGQVNLTAFGILALEAARRPGGNRRSAAWLRETRNEDGGWGFIPGAASDPDSTGAVLQALAAAGGSRAAIRAGVGWLRGAQRRGGGFALSGGPVNAQSTAWATQGLIAAGVAPETVRRGGRSPLHYLASVQAPDGHYRYSRSSDQSPVWVTAQALLAVKHRAFPLAPVARKRRGPARAAVRPSPQSRPTRGDAARSAGAGGPTKRAQPAAPTPREQPPAVLPENPSGPASVEPASAAGDDDDDSTLPVLAGAAVAVMVAAACGWMLHRQEVG